MAAGPNSSGVLTLSEAQSYFEDKLIGIRVSLSLKRDRASEMAKTLVRWALLLQS